jgi:hypothetical protein
MADNPAYIQRMLDRAREEGQGYCGQYNAAARCFDLLALFPRSSGGCHLHARSNWRPRCIPRTRS